MEWNTFDWQSFGYVLAGELVYSLVIAVLVRMFSRSKLHGQTFWMVVVGVAGVMAIATPLIGLVNFGVLLACFIVAALPVGIEYFWRVLEEQKRAELAKVNQLFDGDGQG